MEKKVLSCEFNMDTGCVEVRYQYLFIRLVFRPLVRYI